MNKIIKFGKQGCAPCQMVDMFLNDKGVEYTSVDVFKEPEQAVEFDIGSVPTIVLVDEKGKEIQRSIGFKDTELEDMVSFFKA